MTDVPYKVVYLGRRCERYDLSKLPRKKRKSSSFVRTTHGIEEGGSSEKQDSDVDVSPDVHIDVTANVPSRSSRAGSSTVIVHEADALEAYKLELVTAKGFVVLDRSLTIAALQDFDNKSFTLKVNKYQLVRRYLKSFMGVNKWVYCCSCNPRGMELVSVLPEVLSQTYEEFQDVYATCIHGEVTGYFMERFEALNDIDSLVQDSGAMLADHDYLCNYEIHELPSNNMVCINSGKGNYGFVGCEQKRLRCFTCQHDIHNCVHVNHLTQSLASENSDVPYSVHNIIFRASESPQPRSGTGPVCKSKLPIPFELPLDLNHALRAGLLATCLLPSGEYGVVPPLVDAPCPVCLSPWSADDPVVKGWCHENATAFSMTATFFCKVFHRKCSNLSCNSIMKVDGQEFGFLHIGHRILSYEILRDYMHLFLHAGITLHTFFDVWQERNVDAGNLAFRQLIDYNSWRFAWYAFLRLLDINYHEGWICPLCGPQPDTIVCDGTSVAFQKQFVQRRNNVSEDDGATPTRGR